MFLIMGKLKGAFNYTDPNLQEITLLQHNISTYVLGPLYKEIICIIIFVAGPTERLTSSLPLPKKSSPMLPRTPQRTPEVSLLAD